MEDSQFKTTVLPGADFNVANGPCLKVQAAFRHFFANAKEKNWKWMVLVEDDTSLSVAKILEVIQVKMILSRLYPLWQCFSTFCYLRTPKPNIFSECNVLCTPLSISRTPRGTCTPGWEPLQRQFVLYHKWTLVCSPVHYKNQPNHKMFCNWRMDFMDVHPLKSK